MTTMTRPTRTTMQAVVVVAAILLTGLIIWLMSNHDRTISYHKVDYHGPIAICNNGNNLCGPVDGHPYVNRVVWDDDWHKNEILASANLPGHHITLTLANMPGENTPSVIAVYPGGRG